MKKLSIIFVLFAAVAVISSCSDVKRTPGKIYMPDMAYSRAVETYSDHSNLNAQGIHYDAQPVRGTIKRGDDVRYEMLTDTTGLYDKSAAMVNPLPPLDSVQMIEAERLYLINCGICHGQKLDGNGPLYKDGNGPYPAKPATLVGDPNIEKLKDGTIFHAITYGKNMMGSYASQVSSKQRWMIVHYIKAKQAEKNGGAATTATNGTTAATTTTDSTKTNSK